MESSESLLHPKIARFYEINENTDISQSVQDCINKNCTYNWKKIHILLNGNGEWESDATTFPKAYDEFLSYFERLQPLLQLSHTALTNKPCTEDSEWFANLQWLHHQNEMQILLQEHRQPTSEASPVENILFLTSIVENGLGNIFYTIAGKSPPHLLRDLLDTIELKEFLGTTTILFLKILMGSPESVNIRNIVWHGFPLPEEIPPCYVSTLLIAAASISLLIKEHKIELKSRHRLTDFTRSLKKILLTPLNLALLTDFDRIKTSLENSKWTSRSKRKIYWYRILDHYQCEHYWRCVILILPQIELILRRMFGEANSFDIRAKLDEFYITLNSIFENEDNHLFDGDLCKGVLHLMYDVFISPYGLRIRDKVSHGEVDLDCIDKNLCSILLYIALNLITSNRSYTLDEYRSQFHLNVLAVECIETSRRCLIALTSLNAPFDFEVAFNWDREHITFLQSLVIQKPDNIFTCHKQEPVVYTVLMKIAQLVAQACENYKNAFEERFRMHVRRELRSRARKTLRKMVETMPSITICLLNIVHHLVVISNRLLTENLIWLEENFVAIQRFCKQTLKIVENIARYSDRESNEWLNALDCCNNFKQISQNLFTQIS